MREVTSASNLSRRRLCPGSANAEANIVDVAGEAADEGTLLHPFAENPLLPRHHLSEPHRHLLTRVDVKHAELMTMLANEWGPETTLVPYPKTRLRLQDSDGQPMFSGENDWVAFCPEVRGVIIEDHKMGFIEVDHAADNDQLACYALMWADYLEADSAIVAINQPRAKEPLTVAKYDRAQLEQARLVLTGIYRASQQPDAPRIAGEKQCRFCKAKVFCEEYRAKFEPLALRPDAQTVATLDKDTLVRLHDAVRFAQRIQDQVLDEVRRRVSEGDPEWSDWEMVENGSTKSCTDVVGAYRALADFFSADDRFNCKAFTDCTKLNWKDLTALFKSLTGMSEQRASKLLTQILEPFLTWTAKRPTPRPKA